VSRADTFKDRKPDLVADLWLYPTDQGGRKSAIRLGWGCPCSVQRDMKEAWDGFPLLEDREMNPGESRRVGFAFLSGQVAASALRRARKFYLWEGRFIGEATIVDAEISN
jgi:hypothetical protein